MLPYTYRPKVVVTKIGLDGHGQGSRIVASALRDFGMEVVYTTPWQFVAAGHLLVRDLMIALDSAGMGHVRGVVGGIVPAEDKSDLIEASVSEVFHPASAPADISKSVHAIARSAQMDAITVR